MRAGAAVLGVFLARAAFGAQAVPEAVIVAPASGAVVAGPSVRVVLEASGIAIAPVTAQQAGAAHLHLFLDVDPTASGLPIPAGVPGIVHLGGGQLAYTFDSVAAGEHRLVALLGDNAHVVVPGQKSDTVRFTVAPRAPE